MREKKEDEKQKYENIPFVDNPLFDIIEKPIYGAIAIVINVSGYGKHAGFVYAKRDDNYMCILGGNQSDTIRFSPFNIKSIPDSSTGKGKDKKIKKGNPDRLVFLLPSSYNNPQKNSFEKLNTMTIDELNRLIGIGFENNDIDSESVR